jgi:hypothetical protein
MLSHIFVLRHPIPDPEGLISLAKRVTDPPALILGITAMPLVLVRFPKRWLLVFLYFLFSMLMAFAAAIQAGGNVNYFFESFFATAPFAAFAVVQFGARRSGFAGILIAVLILIHVAPLVGYAYLEVRQLPTTTARNHQMEKLQGVVAERKVLSFVPSVTRLTHEEIVTEPFLLSYLSSVGQYNLVPLKDRICRQEFATVIASADGDGWRGLPHVARGLHPVLAESYEPHCVLGQWLFMLPRTPTREADLVRELANIGCYSCAAGADCKHW